MSPGDKVFIYRNLRDKCWSIRSLKTRRVIGYASSIALDDVTFSVSEAGRQRVIREGRKNVHAGAIGTNLSTPLRNVPARSSKGGSVQSLQGRHIQMQRQAHQESKIGHFRHEWRLVIGKVRNF